MLPTPHDSMSCMLASHLVEVRCLHRACLYLRALLTTSHLMFPHLPIFQRTKKQYLRILLFGCFIVLIVSFTHPTPKWMQGLPRWHAAKESTCQQEMQEMCVRPLSLGRSPGEGNGNPHQYPCLGNSMDRGLVGKESDMTEHIRLWLQLCTSKCKRRPN